MIIQDGVEVASSIKVISSEDYENLPMDQKKNGTTYLIEGPDKNEEDIKYLKSVIGTLTEFPNIGFGPNYDMFNASIPDEEISILDAIEDLYFRFGDARFDVDLNKPGIKVDILHEPITTHPNPLTDNLHGDSIHEQLTKLKGIIGVNDYNLAAYTKLKEHGYSTIIGALCNLYDRLGGLSFKFNDNETKLFIFHNSIKIHEIDL